MKICMRFNLPLKVILVLIALALCLPFVGGIAKAAKIELVVWDTQGTEQQETYKKAVKTFQEKNPDIKLVLEPHPGTPGRPKFITALRTGTQPDIGLLNIYWVKDFAVNNWAVPLDPYLTEEHRSDIIKPYLNICSYKGKTYGIFQSTDCGAVIYRKDLFDQAGVNPPEIEEVWTWDEFVDASKKLTVDKDMDGKVDQWGLGIVGHRSGPTSFSQFPFFWMLGGEILDEEGLPAFNSEAGIKSLQFFHDLVYKHKVSPKESYSYKWSDVQQGILADKYGMVFLGSWSAPSWNKTPGLEGKFGVIRYPDPQKGAQSISTSGGWPWAILSKDRKIQDAAAKFINSIVSKEAMRERCVKEGGLPTRKSVWEMDEFFKTPIMQVYKRQIEGAKMKPGDPIYAIVQDEYTLALQEVMANNKSPDQALRDAEKAVLKKAKDTGIIK